MYLAKVWPLVSGMTGYNAAGQPISLSPQCPGFMEYAAAKEAELEGKLQCMAGLRPQDLKDHEEEGPERGRGEYETRVMEAATPQRRRPGRPRKPRASDEAE